MNETIENLQFEQIKDEVRARAIGDYSKTRIKELQPQTNLNTVQVWQQETQEARLILESNQHVPFMGLTRIHALTVQVQKGLLLTAGELVEYADFIRSSRLIMKFFEKNQYQTPLLYQYTKELPQLLTIEEEIYQKIQHQKVADEASRNLRKVRKRISEIEKETQDKLMKFIRHPQNKELIQERMIVQKEDHYTVPIKAAYKNKVSGNLIQQSARGTTAFIEPAAVAKLNEELILLKAEETAEEYQVLAELTGLIAEEAQMDWLIETITALDIIFARGKYSRDLKGITPAVNKSEVIKIKGGRHPLLPPDAVPLDFALGEEYRGLVITGANAGGKTVVLKTVGLLTLMTMFGLQIPAKEAEIAIFDEIFVDIGDQQNLENALSTFSGHMKNVATILQKASRNTLVLLDEIGSGTEPNEGAALAIAIMENLYEKGALVVATTHYGEIKRFAEEHEDFIPAAMAFDRETLSPRFRLRMHETGDSQALWIAKKMQMNDHLIQRAQSYIQQKAYATEKKTFKKNQPEKQIEKTLQNFAKGDRVQLTETQKEALVWEDQGDTLIVFAGEERFPVMKKRVKLLFKAEELYPAGYDLDSLFSDYATRKRERDLERGSKKTQKELLKEARKRKNAEKQPF